MAKIPEHLIRAIESGGVAGLSNGEYAHTIEELEAHYGGKAPKKSAAGESGSKTTGIAQAEFDAQKKRADDAEAEVARLKAAAEASQDTKALEAYKTRNDEQADLIEKLCGDEACLKRLDYGSLEAVAQFEKVEIPENPTKESLTAAILAGRGGK